ncbi:MAG TPA: hypothetical protein VN618_09135 [Solirubrobacteraceae bacterium]|nr:hypothetical protein [Solirubrobacteraceae bacterium]
MASTAAPLPSAGPPVQLAAALTPNVPGAPTNLSATLTLPGTGAGSTPARSLLVLGPRGMSLDARGLSTCTADRLEAVGPRGCPAQARVGFGGGVGEVSFGSERVREPFVLDFFLAPPTGGRLAVLALLSAHSPIGLEMVLKGAEVRGPSPYGFGLALALPAIETVPGASAVSIESGFVSIGGSNIAYYERRHGVRTLEHVRGLIAPRTCPSGGFPFETTVTFEDGTTSVARTSSPCPARHR